MWLFPSHLWGMYLLLASLNKPHSARLKRDFFWRLRQLEERSVERRGGLAGSWGKPRTKVMGERERSPRIRTQMSRLMPYRFAHSTLGECQHAELTQDDTHCSQNMKWKLSKLITVSSHVWKCDMLMSQPWLPSALMSSSIRVEGGSFEHAWYKLGRVSGVHEGTIQPWAGREDDWEDKGICVKVLGKMTEVMSCKERKLGNWEVILF